MLKKTLQIVIMSRNRPLEIERAVSAALAVNFGDNTELVISDNPEFTEQALKQNFEATKYILRSPALSWNSHFRAIVQECDAEWCLITHDDDELLPPLGYLFQEYKNQKNVVLITGRSKIVGPSGAEIINDGYNMRLSNSKLLYSEPHLRGDLFGYLFDLGTLFPASAMIIRTNILKKFVELDENFQLAADLGLSMLVAREGDVVFQGREFVMNYNVHGGNSVFSEVAAGGLLADFVITRIQMLLDYPSEINQQRMKMLAKSAIYAKLLTSAFDLWERYELLDEKMEILLKRNKDVYLRIAKLFPAKMNPLKCSVRNIMWKKLGVKQYETKEG